MLDRYKSVDITDVLGFANRIVDRLEINMQKLRMYTHLLSILLTISIVLNVYPMLNVAADTDVKSEDVSPTLFQSGEQYDCTSSTKVDSMFFGRKTMGSFTINGVISDISSFDGRKAFGLAHGQLSFDYNCPSAFTDPNLNYYITNDSETKVSTINLDASIGQGVIIVQKSQDGKKWNTVNAITDFFGGHSKGQKAIYTTSGEDINKGCYYRVIVAYAIQTVVDNSIDSFRYSEILDFFTNAYHNFDFKHPADMLNKTIVSRHVEQYEFYACINSGNFSLHNLAVADTAIPNQDGYNVNIIRHGETLEDGAVTTEGFEVDLLNADYSCSVNGREVSDGEVIKSNGKYVVKIKTKLGMEYSKTVYVFRDKQQGFLSYFNESVVLGHRVQDDGDFPSYAYGTELFIKEYGKQTPPLYGKVLNKTNGRSYEIDEHTSRGYQKVLDVGEYQADLYCGKVSSGNLTHFQFFFNIVDREATPHVNKDLLETRHEVQDYKSKHYEVSYATTRGGYIYVCFETEEDAYNYAYEIEKRFIEKHDDGYYYKEHDKPLNKINYPTESKTDRLILTQELVYNARQNVKPAYINPSELYTYQVFSGDQDLLDNLEEMTIEKSIHVFPDVEEREKLIDRGTKQIKEQISYLNGFRFIQAGDYDVTEVSAYCQENKETFPLKFGWKVEDQLNISSIYTITEKNKYGKTNTYDACLMASNQTVSKWKYIIGDEAKEVTLSDINLLDNSFYLQVDSIRLIEATNQYDDHAIIKVTKQNGEYITCLNQEMQNLTLFEAGTYTIELIDRVGNRLTMKIEVSGVINKQDALKNNGRSFHEVYDDVSALQIHGKKD